MGDPEQWFYWHIVIIIVKFKNICRYNNILLKILSENGHLDMCLMIHIANYFTIISFIIEIYILFL